jgi:hypothetical protein
MSSTRNETVELQNACSRSRGGGTNELGVKLFEDYMTLVEGFAFVC